MISEALYNATLVDIIEIIAQETGSEVEEILPDMDLDEDLDIVDSALIRLTKKINARLNTSLDAEEIEEEESVKTIKQLTVVVCEEIELG